MKTKILNIFTALSAAYLTFLGCFNLYCKPFEILEHLSFVNLFATISWEIMLITFGVFCFVKLFVKQKITTNIFTLLLSLSAIIHLIAHGYMYSQIGWRYLALTTKYDITTYLSDGFKILFAVIFILITVNTLKPFISRNVAFVLSVIICFIGLIANIISTTYFANASLRYTINDLMVTKLQYICFLPTVYLALKPMAKESDIK